MFGSSPKFAVAMLINGLDYYNNMTNSSTFNSSFILYDTASGRAILASGALPPVPHSVSEIRVEHIFLLVAVICLVSGAKTFCAKKPTAPKTVAQQSPSQCGHLAQPMMMPVVYGHQMI